MDKRDTDRSMMRRDQRQRHYGAFDETEWVDWDHWQTVEEFQKFMDDLSSQTETELADADDNSARIARQIRRHGLEVTD